MKSSWKGTFVLMLVALATGALSPTATLPNPPIAVAIGFVALMVLTVLGLFLSAIGSIKEIDQESNGKTG